MIKVNLLVDDEPQRRFLDPDEKIFRYPFSIGTFIVVRLKSGQWRMVPLISLRGRRP